MITGKNFLQVQGANDWFQITNGLGQGGVSAARLASASTSEVFERKLKTHPDPMEYRGVSVAVDEFVDDCKTMDMDSKGAKVSGNIISSALDEMALKAHGEKTVQIVVGHQDYITKMKKELDVNPTFIQGFKNKVVDSEKYLGVMVTSSGTKGIIDRNIEDWRIEVHMHDDSSKACPLPPVWNPELVGNDEGADRKNGNNLQEKYPENYLSVQIYKL